jgi:hypothetical protein
MIHIMFLIPMSSGQPPPKRPVPSAPPTFPICPSIPLLFLLYTQHTTSTTMSPPTPLQRLLLRSQPNTPLTTLLTPLSQPYPHHTRLFTTTSRTLAGVRKSKSFAPHQTGMKQPSQKSFEVMKKEQMKNIEQMPNDVGLIPGTFIMPTGSRLPSFTAEFGKRFALEKYRLWLRVKEIFGYVVLASCLGRPVGGCVLDFWVYKRERD